MKKFGFVLILFTLCTILSAQNFGLEFTGTYESEIMIPHTPDLTPTDAVTVEAWVKLDALTSLPSIVSSEDWSAGEAGFVLRIENFNLTNTPQFQIGSTSGWQTVSADENAIPFDEWTHVAGTFDGSSVKIFINGEEAGSTPFSGSILPSPIGVKIGGHVDHSYNNRQWDGAIDEVRIWNVARDAAEITSTMYNNLTGAEDGLQGYWMFNEGAGDELNDVTSNGNNGTIYGAAWVDGAPIIMESGTVEGVVNMIGGETMPNSVLVSVGGISTYPDGSGYFSMEVPPGEYELSCILDGFYPYFADIVVILDETTDITAEVTWLEPPVNLTFDQETNLLVWDAPETDLDISGYRIYTGDELVAETESSELSYQPIDTGWYEVTAMYDEYESMPSESVEAMFYNPPLNLVITLEDDNDARLNWELPLDGGATLTDFKIYRDSMAIAQVAYDVLTYTDEDLLIDTYSYYVTALYYYEESMPSNVVEVEVLVGYEEDVVAPVSYFMNYPNPFNPATTISFSLSTESTEDLCTEEYTRIEIYNIKGQKIETLECHGERSRTMNTGKDSSPSTTLRMTQAGINNSVTWNGTDRNNNPVSSGIYYAVLKSGNKKIATTKMVLLK